MRHRSFASLVSLVVVGVLMTFVSLVSALTYPAGAPAGEIIGGTYRTYFDNMFPGCPILGDVITGFTSTGMPMCITPAATSLNMYGLAGYTLYHNGTIWTGSANIYNNNGNVGIGMTPTTNSGKLQVNGQIMITGGAPGIGKFLVSDASGLASWQSTSATLSGTYWSLSGNTTGINDFLGTLNAQDLVFKSNNLEGMRIKVGGNVGIGTNTPGQKLSVSGSIQIIDGTQGAGKFLVSNALGVASWQSTSATLSGTYWSLSGNTIGVNDFLGSLNPQDLVFRTNNIEKLRIRSSVSSTGALLFINGGDVVVNGMTVGHGNSASSTNTAIGNSALSSNITGYFNTANGAYALYSNTTGFANTANGNYTLYSNTTGPYNTANGYAALSSNTTGGFNTANGDFSLYSNTIGQNNTANGYSALYYNTTGQNNTADGYQALSSNTTGQYNTTNGDYTLSSNTTGSGNVAMGTEALYSATGVDFQTAIGYQALRNSTTGYANSALGYRSLYSNTTGYWNTAIGYSALISNTTGFGNTANGDSALLSNDIGSSNTSNGVYSLLNNTTGSGNVAMGYLALSSAIGVDFQTAIGYQALRNSTTGTQNLALGYQAGSGITTGSNNIAIGYNAQVPSGTLSNQLSIGNWIYGSGGNIGIGTSTPGQKLTISGGTIQIVNGSQAAGYILTSDANGVATWLPAVASSNGWLVTGNAGTSSSTNFLGTLDAQDLVVKTNSGEKMRILSSVSSTGALIFVNGGDIVVNGMTVGHGSGAIQTNTAIGNSALAFNTTGQYNTANGYQTLSSNTTGISNTANGRNALGNNTTGQYNTANGYNALLNNTTGGFNTANGILALFSNTTGSGNVAMGTEALYSATGVDFQTAIGYQALRNSTTGYGNSALGYQALFSNTTGYNNVAIGSGTLRSNTTGDSNTALGYQALSSNTIGVENTANGIFALRNNTTGGDNTANGTYALASNTTGGDNTAIGSMALNSNITGVFNTAVGSHALYISSGNSNTAIGYSALSSNTSGSNNIAMGVGVLVSNTSGRNNVAIGNGIMFVNTSGQFNTAVGYNSLGSNTTGGYNTSNGNSALNTNTTGSGNVAMGAESLFTSTGVDFQTAIGYQALRNSTSGTQNLALGYRAGSGITTGSNNIAIGYNAQVPTGTASNQLSLGNWIYGSGGNIGIGTSTPGAKLEVAGTLKIATAGAYLDYRPNNTACANSQVLAWSGTISAWTCSNDSVGISGSGLITNYVTKWNGAAIANSLIFDNGTNVGIGTSTPGQTLTVSGSALVTSDLTVQGKVISDTFVNRTVNNVTISGSLLPDLAAPIAYRDIGNNTTQSWNNLYLSGQVTIKGGTPGINKVLTSDANGLATWQIIPTSTNSWSTTGNTGTTAGTNFLGTIDAQDLFVKTNNTEKMRILSSVSSTGALLFVKGGDIVVNDMTVGRGNNPLLNNTIVGLSALGSNTTGNYNVALGGISLGNNTVGSSNSAIGYAALYNNTGGNSNTAVGYQSLWGNTVGSSNTAVGLQSMAANTTGGSNTALGYLSLYFNATGNNNTAIGATALQSNSGGSYNTAVGSSALQKNSTGNSNSSFGQYSLFVNTTGSYNSAYGDTSLQSNIIGNYNVAMGHQTLYNNINGDYNIAIGEGVLLKSISGSNNTAIGKQAGYSYGYSNISISNNTLIGANAGYTLSGGANNNVFIGMAAGESVVSGSNNIVLGYDIDVPSSAASNQLNIGNIIFGTNINGTNTTLSTGNIGIGTSTPGAKLEVAGTLKIATAGAYLDYRPNNTACANSQVLAWSGTISAWTCSNDSVGISGSGLTTNYVTKWNGAAIANSLIFDNGTSVAIGNTGATSIFEIWSGSVNYLNFRGTNSIGMGAGSLKTGNTGNSNTSYGNETLYTLTTGYSNSAFGHQALRQSTSGFNNSAFGKEAMYNDNDGTWNTAIGYQALRSGSSTDYNVAIGTQAMYNLGTGTGNVAIGHNALYGALTTASNNTIIGYMAGSGITSGWNNIIIGNGAQAVSNTASNQLNIGNWIYGSGGNIGIGTGGTAITARLTLDSGTNNISGLRMSRISPSTVTYTGTSIGLGIDGSGNVVTINNGDVVVYTASDPSAPPSPNPDTTNKLISYDFNNYFNIPTKQSFVVSDGSSASYNGPFFRENGTSGVCSWNGTYGTSPYNCSTDTDTYGVSASPANSFTMTAKGTTFGYQLALGARGDAPLFARSGRFNGSVGGGLYTNDSPYQTPAPWQRVLTVPANHNEYFYINTGFNSQLQAQSGGGMIGLGTTKPSSILTLSGTAFPTITAITTTGSYIGIGSYASINLLIDNDSIQAKTTASTAGPFYINPFGGNVNIGGSSAPSSTLEVNGTVKLGTNGTQLNNIIKATVVLDVPSIGAGACSAQTLAVTNATTTGTAFVSPASALTDHMIIAYARVSAAGSVEAKFCNESVGAIDLASMNYYVTVIQ